MGFKFSLLVNTVPHIKRYLKSSLSCKVGNFLNNEYCSDEEETWVTLMSRLTLGRQWNEALNHCFVGGGHEKEEVILGPLSFINTMLTYWKS